jgi:hypothetical protein
MLANVSALGGEMAGVGAPLLLRSKMTPPLAPKPVILTPRLT